MASSSATAPSVVWLYDRNAKTLTKLFESRPALAGMPLTEMHPVEIKTRDGMTMVSLSDAPAGKRSGRRRQARRPRADGAAGPRRPLGPRRYGYNGYHQWLANRGYAVLSPNFRASTGFGKDFIKAGNLEWGAQDARRPARRGRLGCEQRHHHAPTRSRSWAAATAAMRRSPA